MSVRVHLHLFIWLGKTLPKNALKRVLWNSSFPFAPRYIAWYILSSEITGKGTDFAEQLFKQVLHEYYKGSVWPGRVITMNGEPLLALRVQVCHQWTAFLLESSCQSKGVADNHQLRDVMVEILFVLSGSYSKCQIEWA